MPTDFLLKTESYNPIFKDEYPLLVAQLQTVYDSEDIYSVREQSLAICEILIDWNAKAGNYFYPELLNELYARLQGQINGDKVFGMNVGSLETKGLTFIMMWNLEKRNVGAIRITQVDEGNEKILRIRNDNGLCQIEY